MLACFHVDSRVPWWPCHCYLKSTIFDPPPSLRAQAGGMAEVKVALYHVFLLIWMWFKVSEFPRWIQGPWVTLPLWPDFDLKMSHFWPPPCTGREDGRGQSGPKSCIPINTDVIWGVRVFMMIPGSLGDPAIVTWFWPQNQPFLTPLCTGREGGRGQSGPKSCIPINIDVI